MSQDHLRDQLVNGHSEYIERISINTVHGVQWEKRIQGEVYAHQYNRRGDLIRKTDRKNNGNIWKHYWYGSGMLKEIVENEYNVVRL